MKGNLLVEKSKAFALKGIEPYKRLLDAREHILFNKDCEREKMKNNHTSSFLLLPSSFSKAFTMVELLVVIGIIGVLAGIMLASFGSGTESARAAKCLANMRNLAQGAIGYATHEKHGAYPHAGSFAVLEENASGEEYDERVGWISWLSMNDEYGRHSKKAKPTHVVQLPNISAYCTDEEKTAFAITNGAIWKYVGRSRDTYVCPAHTIAAAKYGKTVRFSYVMGAAFGYDTRPGECAGGDYIVMTSGRLDRRLLFAELPFGTAGSSYDTANSGAAGIAAYPTDDGNVATDCTLQYKASVGSQDINTGWGGTAEAIAFNHKSGKRWCAHVVFADGHTEKLLLPKSGGLTAEQLSALLGEGVDVTFNGSSYEMAKDVDN